MEEWQWRVVHEKRELDERRFKLLDFMQTPAFKRLDQAEQDRLAMQQLVMLTYSEILGMRIAAFSDRKADAVQVGQ